MNSNDFEKWWIEQGGSEKYSKMLDSYPMIEVIKMIFNAGKKSQPSPKTMNKPGH